MGKDDRRVADLHCLKLGTAIVNSLVPPVDIKHLLAADTQAMSIYARAASIDLLAATAVALEDKIAAVELPLPSKLALAFYVIKGLNLDFDSEQISPARKQIFLRNLSEVEKEVEKAKQETIEKVAASLGRKNLS